MKKGNGSSWSKNAADAGHALNVLIAEGKIAPRDITTALRRREKLIRDLRRRLSALESGWSVNGLGFPRAVGVRRKAKTVRTRKLTPQRRAALKLHGQYLGTVRPLSRAEKLKIKDIREKSGVKAAIAAAKRMARPR